MANVLRWTAISLLAFFGAFALVAGVIFARQGNIHITPFFFSIITFALIKLIYDNDK